MGELSHIKISMNGQFVMLKLFAKEVLATLLKSKKTKLNFLTDISSCDGYDLFLAKGSFQSLEWNSPINSQISTLDLNI